MKYMTIKIYEDVGYDLLTLRDMLREDKDIYILSYTKAPVLTPIKSLPLNTILEKIDKGEFEQIIEIIK